MKNVNFSKSDLSELKLNISYYLLSKRTHENVNSYFVTKI